MLQCPTGHHHVPDQGSLVRLGDAQIWGGRGSVPTTGGFFFDPASHQPVRESTSPDQVTSLPPSTQDQANHLATASKALEEACLQAIKEGPAILENCILAEEHNDFLQAMHVIAEQ
eukprot:TRINITY_DN1343_c0_g2_i4.p2 TRINITY_DN1343_c0_g2~~TRINITY_DN1343_c0_g2_i4.p2  ORF type:complete len:116 (-),score=8.57 TRINITY_DN1343_c0_g2_i4:250-597(-)